MIKNIITTIFISCTIISCNSQNLEKLEGKWKVNSWTYFSHEGMAPEVAEMNKVMNDFILDFKTDGTLSTNKPNEFKFINNSQYKLEGTFLELNNFFGKIYKKNNEYFLLLDNMIMEIEKIKNHGGSKLTLKEITSFDYNKSNAIPIEDIDESILIYDSEKNVYPKIKDLNTEDCGYYCVKKSFISSIIESIDVSKVANDITYLIEVIVDKKGKICNIKVNSIDDYYSVRFPQLVTLTDNKKDLSIVEKTIIQSVLNFQGQVLPAENNNGKINSKLRFVLRVVSNH